MYGLTRRPKLSVLAALPPLALNILHIGTHTLTAALDVFVGSRSLLEGRVALANFLVLVIIRCYTFHIALSRSLLALVICVTRRNFNICLVFWHTKLLGHNHTSCIPYRSSLVR